MHMYIHSTDRLWSEGVTDIKSGEDKLVETVFPMQQKQSFHPDLNYREWVTWRTEWWNLNISHLLSWASSLVLSSLPLKCHPFCEEEWLDGERVIRSTKASACWSLSQALLSCLFSCWAPELKFVWWITETHIWIVCANPARMLHFHNHMQLWGWLNSYTQIQFALRH